MKQLLQDLSSGDLRVTDVPAPLRGPAQVLVATRASLISAGTERTMVDFGKSSMLGKARARPDLVRQVVDAARTDGVGATYAKVRGRINALNPLGYSSAGIVLEAGDDGPAAPGELVACAGAGYANHAEVVAVPRNLVARVPDGVSAEDAAYGTVATIALHGVRLAGVGLGDIVAVIGLGLVGQLTLDLVAAAGAVPVGVDPDPTRVEIAGAGGHLATTAAAELSALCAARTAGRGADAALVTAAASNPGPLNTAIDAVRERATVCVVGDVPIETARTPLFRKELNLVVSRSYGPGRYDPRYEEQGIDYPAGYVRWTEGRNLEEVLRLMATGALRPSRLTTHTFDLDDAVAAYGLLENREERSVGILLRYPGLSDAGPREMTAAPATTRRRASGTGRLRVGVIGAGAFARGTLLPKLAEHASIHAIANATGASAQSAAQSFGAEVVTTDPARVLEGDDVDAVLVATRHDTHAEYVVRALEAGKHVFVEKPLALSEAELAEVEAASAASPGVLMVGFNRRFAPHAVRMRDALGGRGPLVVTYRVSAGRLPREHWTHDPVEGGGRIVGEVCHFVDLATYLCGAAPIDVSATALGAGSEPSEDDIAATLRFADGSLASIVYVALGDASVPKERVEAFGETGAGVLDDFRTLTLHRGGRAKEHKGRRDKGHAAELAAFVEACRTGTDPWPVADMAAVMRATFAIRDAVRGPDPVADPAATAA